MAIEEGAGGWCFDRAVLGNVIIIDVSDNGEDEVRTYPAYDGAASATFADEVAGTSAELAAGESS